MGHPLGSPAPTDCVDLREGSAETAVRDVRCASASMGRPESSERRNYPGAMTHRRFEAYRQRGATSLLRAFEYRGAVFLIGG